MADRFCEELMIKKHLIKLKRTAAVCLVFSLLLSCPVVAAAEDDASQGSNTDELSFLNRPPINLDDLPDPDQFDPTPSENPSGETPNPGQTQPGQTDPDPTEPEHTDPDPTEPDPTVPSTSESTAGTDASQSAGQSEPSAPDHPGSWVPCYYQTDYPNTPYGTGTVATSGCSMTCMAMVVSALTDYTVTPDELAERFRNADGSHIQRMEAIATIYDIKYTKTFALYDAVQALADGKLVVEMVASPSPFSSTQHLILLTGIDSEGKIFVNDPNGKTRSDPVLNHGLTYGFDRNYLATGFCGAWIFEPMEKPQNVESNYSDVQLSQSERDTLAKIIWREARGESIQGQQAVAEVVLNRLISDRFGGNTVGAIVFAEGQFVTAKFVPDTTADELQYKAIDMALSGPNILPTDVFYFSRTPATKNIWGRIGKHIFCRADY